MAVAISSKVLQQIVKIIKKFSFEDIKDSVLPQFPELLWINIKSSLVHQHRKFTSNNVALFMKSAIFEAKLQEDVLIERLEKLQLIDVIFHPNKKIWYGFSVNGPGKSVNHIVHRVLERNINDDLSTLKMNINATVLTHNGITYVALKSKKSKNKSKSQIPIFFALFLGQKCFFCTKSQVSNDLVKVIARSIGYENCKKMKLFGRDLISLNKLHWNRVQNALNTEEHNQPVYKDALPIVKDTGIDFTQEKQRKKYAEACFGDDPPTLELIVINGPQQPIMDKDLALELPNETVNLKWECRSRNIATFLTKLIEKRVLVTPVPYYISNLMMLGKNEIKLKNN